MPDIKFQKDKFALGFAPSPTFGFPLAGAAQSASSILAGMSIGVTGLTIPTLSYNPDTDDVDVMESYNATIFIRLGATPI